MANNSAPTTTPSRAGLINDEFLASFSSVQTEEMAAGRAEVTYHTRYEIWRFTDGKGGSYTNLYQCITRNGDHFSTQFFHGDDAQWRIRQIREEIKSQVEITGMWDRSLCVRFLDAERSVDDLPEIVYGGKTWVPYAGVRDCLGVAPGYYIEYCEWDSTAIRTLRRIGKPNGRKIALLAKPDPVRSSEDDQNSRDGAAIPANPYNKR